LAECDFFCYCFPYSSNTANQMDDNAAGDSNDDDDAAPFPPCVVRDARFRCGRKLVERGYAEEASQVFAILLDQAKLTFGDVHVETAPVYYEYGNALLRLYEREQQQQQQPGGNITGAAPSSSRQRMTARTDRRREAAAAAAERRAKALMSKTDEAKEEEGNDDETQKKPAAVVSGTAENKEEKGQEAGEPGGSAPSPAKQEVDSDLGLALEMMETAWSILDESIEGEGGDGGTRAKYGRWLKEQVPRVLTGLGDVLSALRRHPDAVDAYLRALKYRQDEADRIIKRSESAEVGGGGNDDDDNSNLDLLLRALECRRLLVETCVLIAQELLDCEEGEDVVASETKMVLAKASDRVGCARGYYDNARDELQEAMVLIGRVAAAGGGSADKVVRARDDLGFSSTLLMGVGMELERIDEESNDGGDRQLQGKPSSKKLRTK